MGRVSGLVGEDTEVQGRQQRTLLKQGVAYINPPGVFVASIRLHGTSESDACEKDVGVCAVARHTCVDNECGERVVAVAAPTLASSVHLNASAT